MSILIALYALVVVSAAAIAVDRWLATPADIPLRRRLWEHVWFGELAVTLAYLRHEADHQSDCPPGRATAEGETIPQGGTPDRVLGETSCCSGSSSQ
jgi:hypothetical protein